MRSQPRGPHEARVRLIDSLIDTFMTQPHRWITRKAEAEVTASLLRTPPLTKQLGDHGAKVNVDLDPPPVLTCPPHGGSTMGIERLIPATRDRVAPQLPRDRRRRATETADRDVQRLMVTL